MQSIDTEVYNVINLLHITALLFSKIGDWQAECIFRITEVMEIATAINTE
jgi:hypothetical protein